MQLTTYEQFASLCRKAQIAEKPSHHVFGIMFQHHGDARLVSNLNDATSTTHSSETLSSLLWWLTLCSALSTHLTLEDTAIAARLHKHVSLKMQADQNKHDKLAAQA